MLLNTMRHRPIMVSISSSCSLITVLNCGRSTRMSGTRSASRPRKCLRKPATSPPWRQKSTTTSRPNCVSLAASEKLPRSSSQISATGCSAYKACTPNKTRGGSSSRVLRFRFLVSWLFGYQAAGAPADHHGSCIRVGRDDLRHHGRVRHA